MLQHGASIPCHGTKHTVRDFCLFATWKLDNGGTKDGQAVSNGAWCVCSVPLCVCVAAGELDSVQVMIDVPQQRSGPEGPGFVVQVTGASVGGCWQAIFHCHLKL
jgi:hypothetical protein